MNLHTLALLFKESPEGALPGPPTSWVCLSSCVGGHENWPPLLTPNCVNPTEIDYYIDRLKDELEIVRREAHRRYAAYYREQ
jgi:hypothetical protein